MPGEEDPDYCGPEGNRLRAEANKYGDSRHELMDASHKAYEKGDKAEAKKLSEQGKEAGVKMEATHKKAALVILKHRNDGHGDDYLDLHGLLLDEAMEFLKARLDKLQHAGNEVTLEVIAGAGHHSKAGAVIKPKVLEEIKHRKLAFTEKNAGSIVVTIPGKPATGGAAAAPTTGHTAAPAKGTSKTATKEPGHGGCCTIM